MQEASKIAEATPASDQEQERVTPDCTRQQALEDKTMLLTDSYGMAPGLTQARETYENEFRWGSQFQGVFANALISGSAVDSGNTPTFVLRPGLLLGQNLSDGKYYNYSPTATDGTEVASAVMVESMRMQDFQNTAQDKFYAVLVGGPVQAGKLINLDLQARAQMSSRFIFDDVGGTPGNHWFPWKRFRTKTSSYTVVANDNFTLFDNTGASGTVVLTLPAIANGYLFGAYAMAAQVIRFTSNEGSNVIGGGSLTNSSASVTAIGGMIWAYTNPGATKWIIEQHGTQTITFA